MTNVHPLKVTSEIKHWLFGCSKVSKMERPDFSFFADFIFFLNYIFCLFLFDKVYTNQTVFPKVYANRWTT